MKNASGYLIFVLILLNFSFSISMDEGLAIKYIEGEEIDLNNDGNLDTALLFISSRGYEFLCSAGAPAPAD